jgi:putative heme uptake system protein
MTETEGERRTYLLLDGENIDATLGGSILGQRPAPDDRPRWDRVREFVERTWDQPVTALFFVNASAGTLPMPFIQALMAMGYTPVPLSGPPGVKVVDVGIIRTLEALADRDGDVVLASHDADFVGPVGALLDDRRVALLAFREFVSVQYAGLVDAGLEIFDLEDDAGSFNRRLPRLRIIPLDEFDPADFL